MPLCTSKISYLGLTLYFIFTLHCSEATKLRAFQSCQSLRNYFVSNALKRVGPFGLGTFHHHFALPVPELAADSPFATTDGIRNDAPEQGVDFSGTNIQVENVDEPDIIKTDGRFVYVLSAHTFNVIRVTKSGMNGTIAGKLKLPSNVYSSYAYPSSMLFYQNHVTVFASSSSYSRFYWEPLHNTIVYHIKISANGRPVLRETVAVNGRLVTSRAVNETVRLVLSHDPTSSFSFSYPRNTSKPERTRATRLNKQVITSTKQNDWIPEYVFNARVCLHSRNGTETCQRAKRWSWLTGCKNIYYPSRQFSGFRLLSVATFQFASPIRPAGVSIVADGDTVYSSINSLYVTTAPYMWDIRRPFSTPSWSTLRNYNTSFHKFSVDSESSAAPKYVASGEARGSVLNQFSMHEHNGTFFVATTKSFPWDTNRSSSSSIYSFRQYWKKASVLRQIGYVNKLGIGERIYAVRYIGTTAYVVTFREVDPLYIIDLSHPFFLRKQGELKIPGYSSYVHPIGNDKLLGVGQDATQTGRITGAKVSLFDVSDVSKPRELSSWKLKDSSTEAEWDHKAFLYWKPQRIAVLPVITYRDFSSSFAGSIIINVADRNVSERGRIRHRCCGWFYDKQVRRNLVVGRMYLWSLSTNALQINDIHSLKFKNNIRLSQV